MECMPHRRVSPLAPIIGLDIDGTLADYHGHFKAFAEMYLGRALELDWNGVSGKFSEALHLEEHVYRDIKLAYRQGGMKRSIPFFPGAAELVQEIRDMDIQVWICTTRPYLRLDNIDPDTRESFRRNRIEPDGLIYGEDKYLDLAELVDPAKVICVAEDIPSQYIAARSQGFAPILRRGPHNEHFTGDGYHITEARTIAGLREAILGRIKAWQDTKLKEL